MTIEPELIAAAAIATLQRHNQAEYAGRADAFYDALRGNWVGDYSLENFSDALSILRNVGGASKSERLSADFIRIDVPAIMSGLRNPRGTMPHPKKRFPLLWEFGQFGEEWLKSVWADSKPSADAEATAPTALDELEYQIIDSAGWTGIASQIVTAANAEKVRVAILQAKEAVRDLGSNERTAQAMSYLSAAEALTDAPEPPSKEIWDFINRAGALCGILGFFITLFMIGA